MKILISKSILENVRKKNKDINYENEIKKALIYEEIITPNIELIFQESAELFQGLYIEEKNIIIYFTQEMDIKTKKPKSRNTFVSQNFEPIFNFRKKINNNCKILITLNFMDFSVLPTSLLSDSIILNLRILLTHTNIELGKSINKLLKDKIESFRNLDEYISDIKKSSDKNKYNIPTYIEKNIKDKVITVFGKLDGANFGQTIQHCRNLQILGMKKYKIEFYLLSKENSKNYSNSRINLIDEIIDEIIDSQIFEKNEKIFARNQAIFRINIIEKYRNIVDINKCFCCDYPISENLIAAHIHRHSDIEKDLSENLAKLESGGSISKIEKDKQREALIRKACELTTSGSNGFLFCRNHDIEFEKGMIFFNLKDNKFSVNKNRLSNTINDLVIPEYIQEVLEKYRTFHDKKIQDDLFKENIIKHYERLNIYLEKNN